MGRGTREAGGGKEGEEGGRKRGRGEGASERASAQLLLCSQGNRCCRNQICIGNTDARSFKDFQLDLHEKPYCLISEVPLFADSTSRARNLNTRGVQRMYLFRSSEAQNLLWLGALDGISQRICGRYFSKNLRKASLKEFAEGISQRICGRHFSKEFWVLA